MGYPFGPPFGFKGLKTGRFTYSKNMNQIIKPLSSFNQKCGLIYAIPSNDPGMTIHSGSDQILHWKSQCEKNHDAVYPVLIWSTPSNLLG